MDAMRCASTLEAAFRATVMLKSDVLKAVESISARKLVAEFWQNCKPDHSKRKDIDLKALSSLENSIRTVEKKVEDVGILVMQCKKLCEIGNARHGIVVPFEQTTFTDHVYDCIENNVSTIRTVKDNPQEFPEKTLLRLLRQPEYSLDAITLSAAQQELYRASQLGQMLILLDGIVIELPDTKPGQIISETFHNKGSLPFQKAAIEVWGLPNKIIDHNSANTYCNRCNKILADHGVLWSVRQRNDCFVLVRE